jgi:hypothetical protein
MQWNDRSIVDKPFPSSQLNDDHPLCLCLEILLLMQDRCSRTISTTYAMYYCALLGHLYVDTVIGYYMRWKISLYRITVSRSAVARSRGKELRNIEPHWMRNLRLSLCSYSSSMMSFQYIQRYVMLYTYVDISANALEKRAIQNSKCIVWRAVDCTSQNSTH